MRRLHLTHLNISSTHFFSLKITAPKPQSYTSACTRRRRNKKKHPQRACIMPCIRRVRDCTVREKKGETYIYIYIMCIRVLSHLLTLLRVRPPRAQLSPPLDTRRCLPPLWCSSVGTVNALLPIRVCVCIYVNRHMYLLVCSSLVVSMRERKPIMRALRSPAYEVANFRSISHSARAFGFPFFVRAPHGSCELKILMESKMHHGVLR